MEKTHTYRFNRPISLLFLLPMVLLMVMLGAGLAREFSLLALVLALFTLVVVVMVVYFSMLRSLTVGPEGLSWKAPGSSLEMQWEELRHFGIVKYRSFRFIYLSRSEGLPFEDAQARVVTTPDTFVIQYRDHAWKQVRELAKQKRPGLEAGFMERGR